jgi:hypothetical protein
VLALSPKPYPKHFFALVIFFWIGSYVFAWASFVPQSSYLCLPHNWNYRHMPPLLACWFRWSLTDFLPSLSLNHYPPVLQLLSSWECRHALLFLCYVFALIIAIQIYFTKHLRKSMYQITLFSLDKKNRVPCSFKPAETQRLNVYLPGLLFLLIIL